jgi:hypothetical protein
LAGIPIVSFKGSNGGYGIIYLTETLPEDEWIYRMILSLGDQVEVLELQHIRQIIKERAKKNYDKYEHIRHNGVGLYVIKYVQEINLINEGESFHL